MSVEAILNALSAPVNKISEDITGSANELIDSVKVVVVNGEVIVAKTSSDVFSTLQFALFGLGVIALIFIANTSGDKLADTVIVPSKMITTVAKKI